MLLVLKRTLGLEGGGGGGGGGWGGGTVFISCRAECWEMVAEKEPFNSFLFFCVIIIYLNTVLFYRPVSSVVVDVLFGLFHFSVVPLCFLFPPSIWSLRCLVVLTEKEMTVCS